jgi:hypothetical protein
MRGERGGGAAQSTYKDMLLGQVTQSTLGDTTGANNAVMYSIIPLVQHS